MVVQLLSQALPFFLYSHRVSVALPPVIEEEMVSLPLPAPTTAVGVAGFGGRVRKDVLRVERRGAAAVAVGLEGVVGVACQAADGGG